MLGPGFQKKNSMISFSRFIVWTRRATARAAATAWAWPSPNAASRYTRAASKPTTDPKAACASAYVCRRKPNAPPFRYVFRSRCFLLHSSAPQEQVDWQTGKNAIVWHRSEEHTSELQS